MARSLPARCSGAGVIDGCDDVAVEVVGVAAVVVVGGPDVVVVDAVGVGPSVFGGEVSIF